MAQKKQINFLDCMSHQHKHKDTHPQKYNSYTLSTPLMILSTYNYTVIYKYWSKSSMDMMWFYYTQVFLMYIIILYQLLLLWITFTNETINCY